MWPYDEREADWLGHPTTGVLGAAHHIAHSLTTTALRVTAPLRRWAQARRLAEELYGLSDRDLADIGLTRGDVPAVAEGSYRDPEGGRTRIAPISARLDAGLPKAANSDGVRNVA
ncbi:MAG: DUF1127 domain-containing protein [Rhodospirillales bacterium]|nr:DUF1127 domain-containing protein [Rhodospirillales bacterium]